MTVIQVGTTTLRIPEGVDAKLQSDVASAEAVAMFVRSSPDHCVYHSPAYMSFGRAQNGVADLLLLERGGRPMVALPLHPYGKTFFRSGYAGVLFPDSRAEAQLEASAAVLHQFLAVNPSLGYESIQSAQARGYEDPERCALIDSLLAGHGVSKRDLYSRVLRLTPERAQLAPSAAVSSDALDNDLLAGYEGKKRSEIRQGIRNGVRLTYDLLQGEPNAARTRSVYERYVTVHEQSWERTGLRPHADAYWSSLSEAVQRAGGSDLVVLALSPSGTPVAGVTCHLFEGRAIYWSGGSLPAGMTLKANPMCLHAAITLCQLADVSVFELGRFDPAGPSAKEHAVTEYKAQFRGSIVRLVNFWRPPDTRAYWLRAFGGRLVRAVRRGSSFKSA